MGSSRASGAPRALRRSVIDSSLTPGFLEKQTLQANPDLLVQLHIQVLEVLLWKLPGPWMGVSWGVGGEAWMMASLLVDSTPEPGRHFPASR